MSAFRQRLNKRGMPVGPVHLTDPRYGRPYCGVDGYLATVSSSVGFTCKRCKMAVAVQRAAVTAWATGAP